MDLSSLEWKMTPSILNYDTQYGFRWGCLEVVRGMCDSKKGWVYLFLQTPKMKKNNGVHVYVTKTGKVRVFYDNKEWTPKR